jgi:radical SAM protein with 4Fe4S-binding SPASM domain
MTDLYLLAINLTRRCNLACAHCYLDAETLEHGGTDELRSDEVRQLLSDIAARSADTMVVLTGGEPLLRHDLEDLVKHGADAGLSMVVGTNGVLLSEQRVHALKQAGALGAGISIDSLDPDLHDAFRGCPGSWEKTLAGMEACRRHDLPFQVHFSVTEANAHEVPGMIDFARSVGAKVLNVFFLVCTGRGERMSDIRPRRYEQVLTQLVEAQQASKDLLIRARCAPHFKRIAFQHDPSSPLTRAAGYEGGGCLAGIHYCRITPEGGVTACPYIPDEEASVRERPFWEIWDHSPTFQTLRHPKLNGKCGRCEYQRLCGGCRARPLASGRQLMDADPWCSYRPSGSAVIEPMKTQPSQLTWSLEAEQRLARVPSFLRKMVKKRAETYAQEQGARQVTGEHLATLASRQFGDAGPPKGTTPAQETTPHAPDTLPWTEEAWERLAKLPSFLQEGVRQVAEDVARTEGRLEVNVKMLDRLEAEDEPGRRLSWTEEAEQLLQEYLANKKPEVRMFVTSALESNAERVAKQRQSTTVEQEDVEAAIRPLSGGVEWDPEALARVASAPDFIRAGIKKAAEFNARREGLERITSKDLTRFRNRAMMRAVCRMKGFGMQELSFDAYDIARTRVPRLKENREADKRFDAIRRFVESRENPGELLGQELLERMKEELRNNVKRKA